MATSKTGVQAFLTKLPLFNELSPNEIDRLAAGTTQVQLARNEMVFHRGDPCVGFHIIMYGQVKLMFVSPMGDEKVVRLLGPGDSFGEALMFLDKAYIVSAQALSDCMVIHVAKSVLLAELDSHPLLARKMLAGLSQRLHSLMSDVEAYTLRSGTQRVIAYLLQDKQDWPPGGLFRLETSKAVIASRLNLTPEHFSRILHELAAHGLIKIKGREITIMDAVRLGAYRG